ncbi:AAA family ATPase [bacterium]|nr:AAA family ATPase [bacterium]
MKKYEVKSDVLKLVCDFRELNFKTTAEIKPLTGLIGQERAKKALEFGLNINSVGYNIFVTGISGTGRTTSVEQAVKKMAESRHIPDDWCYVFNFTDNDMPSALRFPPGRAVVFKKEMDELVGELLVELPKAFESQLYEEHKTTIIRELQVKKNELFDKLEKGAEAAGFKIKKTSAGVAFVPIIGGKPLTDKDIDAMTDSARETLRKKQELLYEELTKVLRIIRSLEKEAQRKLNEIEKNTAKFTIHPKIEELKEKYRNILPVYKYLEDVENDMLENIEEFKDKKEVEILPGVRLPEKQSLLYRYQVNVFIDNSRIEGAPVIKEPNPTSYNLSGKVEYKPQYGGMVTDFTMIKPGALHKANGGYLILQAIDVLKNYFSWETLKRAIKNSEIIIEDLNEQFRLVNTPTLRPAPIPLNVKIILIGNPMLYYMLFQYDEEFQKLFKVKADYSVVMNRNKQGVSNYAALISKICSEENLKHCEAEAVGSIVEYGSRVANDQNRLTTRFVEIADIIREANFWAVQDNSEFINKQHIETALEEKVFRSNLAEKRLEELITEGTLMVDTDGAVVGQINGLSVMTMGDYSFGKPSRITARVYTGLNGMINIDREVKLARTIHNKGFLILSGYLGEKYGENKPLAFSASICFEQLYDEIEGDSASSTELYVLLSALSGLPIKQGIAVTGSVNQKGEIQPVGGINEKIEGFYYTCKSKKLTGEQGVIIPHQNLKHLMLKNEIIEAVKKGDFHIWAVSNVDMGIEILTGKPAGEKNSRGNYPVGTVNYLVEKKLDTLYKNYSKFQIGIKGKKVK